MRSFQLIFWDFSSSSMLRSKSITRAIINSKDHRRLQGGWELLGIIGAILGFYGDNGKENGNYYIGVLCIIIIFTIVAGGGRGGCAEGGAIEA